MRCRTCHYDLAHLTEHRCPECSREFDPGNPRTFRLRHDLRWRWWVKLPISIALAIPVIWFWMYWELMQSETNRGGWFDSLRGRAFLSSVGVIAEWWWSLIVAAVPYLFLSSVGWVQVWLWKRRTTVTGL